MSPRQDGAAPSAGTADATDAATDAAGTTLQDLFSWEGLREGLVDWLIDLAAQNAYVLAIAVWSVISATSVTVRSGTTGLLFSFGRARSVVDPGLKILIPFFQIVRAVPTRERTMDLPSQRVTTLDGLVFLVDANIVYRIVDVRKALIEVDQLLHGMRQMLALSVQEVLRGSDRTSLKTSDDLDEQLHRAMARRLDPWGVEIVHASFTSIAPSSKSLRVTQLTPRVRVRERNLHEFEREMSAPVGVALLGTRSRLVRRTVIQREREIRRRRRRRVDRVYRKALLPFTTRLTMRERTELRRRLLVEAGFRGVLDDGGLGELPLAREAYVEEDEG